MLIEINRLQQHCLMIVQLNFMIYLSLFIKEKTQKFGTMKMNMCSWTKENKNKKNQKWLKKTMNKRMTLRNQKMTGIPRMRDNKSRNKNLINKEVLNHQFKILKNRKLSSFLINYDTNYFILSFLRLINHNVICILSYHFL